MKRTLLTLTIFLCLTQIILAQNSHLSLIYDFEGNNFDHSVTGMVGANDSLYIISNTPDGRGIFFRIDENGNGYDVIWEFDNVHYAPSSLMCNDTIIYGTTRFSSNYGGAIFKYSLTDYSFEIVKDFPANEVQEVQIKYVTDSVLWLSSQASFEDEGSIFTINPDGTGFQKIYNDTNLEKGQNPVDFIFHDNKIYIACYNGGGTPTSDGMGGTVSSGCFIRINADGTGYENIVPGGAHVGTQPQSLIIRENKLFGLFAYSGALDWRGQFFSCNLDGTSYDSLGALADRALTRMLSTDSLIYGVSSSNVFGVNPVNGEIRIFDDLESNPDFGADVVSSPAYLNGNVYITAQQGGPNGGGTILKWLNKAPEVLATVPNGRSQAVKSEIDLNELFTDPERDFLTFSYEYDEESVTISESNGILTWTVLQPHEIDLRIIATDGWAGYNSTTFRLSEGNVVTGIDKKENSLVLYPNPARSIIKLNTSNVQSIEVLRTDGKSCASFLNPGDEIDISSLQNGIYFIRSNIGGDFHVQKIVKY
jgi:hypothetical protein